MDAPPNPYVQPGPPPQSSDYQNFAPLPPYSGELPPPPRMGPPPMMQYPLYPPQMQNGSDSAMNSTQHTGVPQSTVPSGLPPPPIGPSMAHAGLPNRSPYPVYPQQQQLPQSYNNQQRDFQPAPPGQPPAMAHGQTPPPPLTGKSTSPPGSQNPPIQSSYQPPPKQGSVPLQQPAYPQIMQQLASMNINNAQEHPSSMINLLQQRHVLPKKPVEPPLPKLSKEYQKTNANPDVFRSTLTSLPQTQALLNKCRLPLGILLHPFKDMDDLVVLQPNTIVRCRSCRTYINPFVSFVDNRRWRCNLCFRTNDLPEEFNICPVTKTYGAPNRRPEVNHSTVEYIAPSEYMLRPPQPAVYLFLFDVSYTAMECGYLQLVTEVLLDKLEQLPGDQRTQIGFLTYNSSVHFYNLAEGLSQPQMLVVSDLEEIFLPTPDSLLVNLSEGMELVTDLLQNLPSMFSVSGEKGSASNTDSHSALGAALQVKFLHPHIIYQDFLKSKM
jgi:protein transport protein SEC24